MIIDSLKYNGLCKCGREHKMETVFSIIESGCLKKINQYISEYGLRGKSVAIYDENTYSATADRHPSVDLEIVLPPENLHANEHGVELVMEKLPDDVGYFIAVGSGTVHDITRYCAHNKNVDFVSCPTAASVDGFCSSVAAMTWNGCKKTFTARSPKIVVADTEIIKNAPVNLAKSGIGDMIGKYIALADWRIANILTKEFLCEKIFSLTESATDAVLKSAKGIAAGESDAYEKLMYGLLLSGLAMQMMGNSRPASGAEHHISHIIEMEPENLAVHSDALHGEKVGVGTLLATARYKEIIEKKDIKFCDYSPFSEAEVEAVFGKELTKGIMLENENDPSVSIKAKDVKAVWADISKVIKALPEEKELLSLYNDIGIKSTLADIGVANEFKDDLLKYSPSVRVRLTFMRLLRCVED